MVCIDWVLHNIEQFSHSTVGLREFHISSRILKYSTFSDFTLSSEPITKISIQ